LILFILEDIFQTQQIKYNYNIKNNAPHPPTIHACDNLSYFKNTIYSFHKRIHRGAGKSIIGGGADDYSCSASFISFESDCFYSL
jgi:hypothetical protein